MNLYRVDIWRLGKWVKGGNVSAYTPKQAQYFYHKLTGIAWDRLSATSNINITES